MIIDCLADLHGHYPETEGGDLLIIAGDLTANDTLEQQLKFYIWLHRQKYKHYIFIAGNHDNAIANNETFHNILANTTYLCDSGTEFEGLKVWGSPWTKQFKGMNPKCKAFTKHSEDELYEYLKLIPYDVDVLITHSPPYGILDKTISGENVGSLYLMGALMYFFRPKLWVFGHVHEAYGQETFRDSTICVTASHVNERYAPINKPVRILL
jgi:Icc-related predicted phosphoesterase